MALFSGTTQVSRYQKGKTNLDFTEARDSEWQWHQLGHMQVCTLLQTDNHASTPPLNFLQAGCPSCRPTNSVKALKAILGINQRTGCYLNNTMTLRPLSPHIMPCYTHKMAIVSWPYTLWQGCICRGGWGLNPPRKFLTPPAAIKKTQTFYVPIH